MHLLGDCCAAPAPAPGSMATGDHWTRWVSPWGVHHTGLCGVTRDRL